MSYKLSRRDIRFMAIPYSVTNFLGLTPPYHFAPSLLNPSATRNPTLKHNVQVAIEVALILAVCVYTLTKMTDQFMAHFLDHFLYAIDTICHYAVTFLTLRSSLLHENWAKLNNNLQLMDRIMLLRQANRRDQTSLWRNPTIHFVLFNMAVCPVITVSALSLIVDQQQSIVDRMIFSTSLVWCEYTNLMIQFLMCSIVLALKQRFVDVKSLLVENIHVAILADVLEDTVTAFNASFGWIILVLLLHNLVQMLTCIHLLITSFEFNGISLMSAALFAEIFMYSTLVVWIVLACNSTGKELKEIGTLARKLRHENEAMTTLAYCCGKLQFTAAGLVAIDRKTLLQFLSVMTTYLIVLLQLRTN